MTTPVTDIEKQRMVLAYEEKLSLQRAVNYVRIRLLKKRAREQELQWHTKEVELHDNELATLNVLEDARALEEQLQEQRDRLDLIISSMGEGLLLIDESFHIVLINAMAASLLGIPKEDALEKDARTIITLWKGNDLLSNEKHPITTVFATEKPITLSLADDFFCQMVAREKFPIALTITPIMRKTKNAIIVFRDITEEKSFDEARKNFISLASHQLRTPLTAIRWYTELLSEKGTGTLNAFQKKFVQQVYEGANRLSDMINLLLSLARIEGGALEINPSEIILEEFLKTIVDEYAPLAKKEKKSLTLSMPAYSVPTIFLDPTMLREVTINLIANAIQYSQEKGMITISFSAGTKEITVGIADDGIGIPLTQQNRIFEKFFRADNARTKVSEGTGLGLNLARSLVSLWRGRMWFVSWEGKGSTFYFTIPYEKVQTKKSGKPLV